MGKAAAATRTIRLVRRPDGHGVGVFCIAAGDKSQFYTFREIPCEIGGHRIVPSTSIGLAIAGLDGDDVTTLLKNADLALYRAKRDGKGCARFFEAAMDAQARARRQMELDLHDALRQGQLFLMFQPLFNLAQGGISSFEALFIGRASGCRSTPIRRRSGS